MHLRGTIAIGMVSSAAALAAPVPPPQAASTPAPAYPNGSDYCRPARVIMDRFYAGARPRDMALREARAAAKTCEATNPLGYYLSMSQIEGADGKPAEAVRLANLAISIAPNHPEALRRLCLAHSTADLALQNCRKAVAAAPDNSLVHMALADRLRGANMNQQAIPSYDRALAIDPNNHAARINRGITYINLGIFTQALADLESADRALSDTHPDASVVARFQATALIGMKRRNDAYALLTRRLTIAPTDDFARVQRGQMLLLAGRDKEAFDDCAAVLKRNPGNRGAANCQQLASGRIESAKYAADKAAKKAADEARERNCVRMVATSSGRPVRLRMAQYPNQPGKYFFYGDRIYYTLSDAARVSVRLHISFEGETTTPPLYSLEVEAFNDLLWGASAQEKQRYNDYAIALSGRLEKDRGYPMRIDIRSGGLPVSIEKNASLITLDFKSYVSTPTAQQVQEFAVARKIAETGAFNFRATNARTGEVLLNRNFTIPGLASDRKAIYDGFAALRAANSAGQCMTR